MSRWRFAARLAWREVRRRPGRSALVMLLVLVPVCAMTVGSVMGRTHDVRDGDFASQWHPGSDDIVVYETLGHEVDWAGTLDGDIDVRSAVRIDWAPIETNEATVIDSVLIEDPGAGRPPLEAASLREGQWPEQGEVWLSSALADELDVDVGNELTLRHPEGTWLVAGTGRFDAGFDRDVLLIPDLPTEEFAENVLQRISVLDLPAGTPNSGLRSVGEAIQRSLPAGDTDWDGPGGGVSRRDQQWESSSNVEFLAWGWVAGVIALAATGIIVAAAFATSARRQLVTIGLLSSSGAGEQSIRRVLALQGFWTGLAGSVLGAALAVVGLIVGRGTIEEARGQALASYRFTALDLLVIIATGTIAATAAARIPARTAARVPVMAALAGRRPLGVVPPKLAPRGIGLFVFGIFLLVVATSTDGGDAPAAAAVVGGVLVLIGLCCCSPIAVQLMGNVAARVGRTWRFAGRSLARTRVRTAAAVTAVGVTGALAIAGASFASSVKADEGEYRQWPSDAAVVSMPDEPTTPEPPSNPTAVEIGLAPIPVYDFDEAVDSPVPADVREQITAAVPGATWNDLRVVTWDEPPGGSSNDEDPLSAVGGALVVSRGMPVVVGDEATVDLYELSEAEQSDLDAVGALLLDADYYATEPPTAVRFETERGSIEMPVAIRRYVLDSIEARAQGAEPVPFEGVRGTGLLLVTEDAARAAGLGIVVNGGFVRGERQLNATQRHQIAEATNQASSDMGSRLGGIYRDSNVVASSGAYVMMHTPDEDLESSEIQGLVAGGALLLTLLVVGITLSLSAAEGRDERDTLVAVGARPATLRTLAGAKATMISATGLLLAVPAGLVPVFAIVRAIEDPFVMPWLVLAGLVVVPAIAGVVATAASSIAQRARPVHMSTLAAE